MWLRWNSILVGLVAVSMSLHAVLTTTPLFQTARASLPAEDTFEKDLPLAETEPLIRKLADKVWVSSKQNARKARTIVLKLKTKEFGTLTKCVLPVSINI
jgi:nucleotidyltransferase/DNA polymerase involved in DNA repair